MKPVVITLGEPAGIGPDIFLKLAKQYTFSHPIVVIGDRDLLRQRAQELHLTFSLPEYQPENQAPFSILHLPLQEQCITGHLNANNSPCVIKTLEKAIQGCLHGEFSALVTGPIHKSIINEAGIPFQGHTEYLAQQTGREKPVMMFVHQQHRLVLLTTHLPLSQVVQHITQENISSTIKIVHGGLRKYFGITNPKIAVTGLNPHAGEKGYLGQEEITIIEPALNILRQQQFNIYGPLSADTIFHWAKYHPVDVIISMYHDQSLPVLKTVGFGDIINVTLGLPMVRTSVDHGTALEIAGTGQADESSLVKATELAIQMLTSSPP